MANGVSADVKAMIVDTLGGRIQVFWDKESAARPFGQLVFFAEFLDVGSLFDTWVKECPLIAYSGASWAPIPFDRGQPLRLIVGTFADFPESVPTMPESLPTMPEQCPGFPLVKRKHSGHSLA